LAAGQDVLARRTRAILVGALVALHALGAAAAHGEEPAPGEADKSFAWDLRWAGWNGLEYELRQRVEVGGPDRLIPYRLIEDRIKLKGKVGGTLAIDGAAFSTSGSLPDIDDGFEVRRARVYTIGELDLVLPLFYKLEISVIRNQAVAEENYLGVKNVPLLQSITAGNMKTPFSLESRASFSNRTFMEEAAPTQAFAPGTKPGLAVGGPVLDQRATWRFGLFSGASNQQIGNLSGLATAIGRLTWLAVDRDDDGTHDLVHLGLSGSVSAGSNQQPVRYRARPEAHLAPYLVDTGDIDAGSAWQVGLETAVVHGPLALQTEFFRSTVEDKLDGSLAFNGVYVYGSWFVTGESRPYDRATGVFTRVRPRRDLSLRGGGFGALELAVRFSHVDLDSGPVQGGIMDLGTTGLTWYWNPNVRAKANYITGAVHGASQNGRLRIFEARFEVDF
jgi:phosphate-selective porin OprO/OprP